MTIFGLALYFVGCTICYFLACVMLFKWDEKKRGENK